LRQTGRAKQAVEAKQDETGKPGDAGRKSGTVRHGKACRAEGGRQAGQCKAPRCRQAGQGWQAFRRKAGMSKHA
jgi:hypothetical protein